MAAECGGCFLTWAEVRSGHVVKRPSSMARHQVDRLGENMEACMKAIRSAMVEVAMAELAEQRLAGVVKFSSEKFSNGDGGSDGSRLQSRVMGD